MKHVVFDIGAVLVNWQPELAWSDEMGEAGALAFLKRTGFDKINVACDAGATFAEAAKTVADPADAVAVTRYVAEYPKTLPSKITGSWDCLYALKQRGVPVHAITNWSAETWPRGLTVFPELGEVFDTLIVSGQVGMIKPSVEIFRLFCARAGAAAEDCIFIDDGLHNCIGARAAGMDAIHFTSSEALRSALEAKGLL